MIFITITHARDKFLMLVKLFLLIILLGLLVPKLYLLLSEAGSLHRWAEKEELPQAPMRVEQVSPDEEGSSWWAHVLNNFK